MPPSKPVTVKYTPKKAVVANVTRKVQRFAPVPTEPAAPAEPAVEPAAPAENGLANFLKATLASAFVFYHAAHRAHWNVMGPDFVEYHELFGSIYEDTLGSIDPFAEYVRTLKAFPLNLSEVVAKSALADDTTTSDARELATDLQAKNASLIEMLKGLFRSANDADEQGIANFVAERIARHQKWDWQLSSSIS